MKRELLLLLPAALFLGAIALACRPIIYKLIEPKSAPLENVEIPEGLSELSASQCGACHAEIYEEWKQSMHAQAWVDPLFQHDYDHQSRPYICTYCHTPVGQQRELIVTGLKSINPLVAKGIPNEAFDPKLQSEGVTCVGCHLREGKLRGPHPLDEADAPHPFVQDKTLSTPETCKTCHALGEPLGSDLKRPILDTFAEWEEYKQKGGDKDCLDCHMPAVERPTVAGGPVRSGRRHIFQGGHSKEFVKTAISVRSLEASRVGKQIQGRLVLSNETGHRLPTAEPARRIEVILDVLGPEGEVLASQVERVERVVKIPGFDEVSDNTFLPREVRTFTLAVDAPPGAVAARISVRYFLWEPTSPIAEGIPAEDLITTLMEEVIPL